MHPFLTQAVAARRRDELLRAAARHRVGDAAIELGAPRSAWHRVVATGFARAVNHYARRNEPSVRPVPADVVAHHCAYCSRLHGLGLSDASLT